MPVGNFSFQACCRKRNLNNISGELHGDRITCIIICVCALGVAVGIQWELKVRRIENCRENETGI